ncbi:MAG: hypothetical protein MJ219_01145 [Mycoplasmoidaceae bacterium]|nr:hypothetical protein [Mycoplasmoidaceae bacterium]
MQNGLAYTTDGSKVEVPNLDVFNYIDQATAGTVDANASFTNKYINEIITMDKIDKFFPAKITDDYKNEIEDIENPKINYF